MNLDLAKIFGLLSGGDYMEAHIAINQMITKQPERLVLYANRGIILKALGRNDEAYADYAKVIAEANPATEEGKADLVSGYYNRANLNGFLGKIPEAIKDFSKVIELQPDYYEAYTGLAKAHIIASDHDAAFPVLEQATKIRPEDPHAFVVRGMLHNKAGRTDEAREDLGKAWKMGRDQSHPATRIDWEVVGDILVDLGGEADPKYNI